MESRKHILFVDDDQNFLAGLFRSLHTKAGQWKMSSANSADEAIEALAQESTDVVVTDFRMGVKDGLELLQMIMSSELTCDIPVIMLTGSDESTLKQRALELGATDLLGKPVVREDLIARISSAIRLKESQDELKTMNQSLETRVRDRTAELEQSRLEMIWRLAKAGEYRDEGTGNHVLRVGYYCKTIAEEMGADQDFIRRLFLTSPLHDIGKIGIPDAILKKCGTLTPEERAIMQKHCEIGAKILAQPHSDQCSPWISSTSAQAGCASDDNDLIEMAASIALAHHERWDGDGYPRQLAGNQIPIEALIVAIADVYDALSTARTYKPAFSHEKALEIMRSEQGTHYSPDVFAAFEASLNRIFTIQDEIKDQFHDESLDVARKAA
ncbi:MAG: HD domain-containing phosphohydrolase [Armatimonadota bacterium]